MGQFPALGTTLCVLNLLLPVWPWKVTTSVLLLRRWLARESSGGLIKTQFLGPSPRASNSLVLGWGPGLRVSRRSQTRLMLPALDHAWSSCFWSLSFFFVKRRSLSSWLLWELRKRIYIKSTASDIIETQQRGSALIVIYFTNYYFYIHKSGSARSAWYLEIGPSALCHSPTVSYSSTLGFKLLKNLSTQSQVILDRWGWIYLHVCSRRLSFIKHFSLSEWLATKRAYPVHSFTAQRGRKDIA